MSDFEDRFSSSGLPRLIARSGDSTSLTSPSGTTITRRGVYNRQIFALNQEQDAKFTYLDEDSSDGLTEAQAVEGTRITFRGVTWTVVESRRDEDGGWSLLCKAPKVVT